MENIYVIATHVASRCAGAFSLDGTLEGRWAEVWTHPDGRTVISCGTDSDQCQGLGKFSVTVGGKDFVLEVVEPALYTQLGDYVAHGVGTDEQFSRAIDLLANPEVIAAFERIKDCFNTGREVTWEGGYNDDAEAHDLMTLAFQVRVQLERAVRKYPVCDDLIVKLCNLDGQYEERDLGKALLYLTEEFYTDDEGKPLYEKHLADDEGWWTEGMRRFNSNDGFIIGQAIHEAFQQQKENE